MLQVTVSEGNVTPESSPFPTGSAKSIRKHHDWMGEVNWVVCMPTSSTGLGWEQGHIPCPWLPPNMGSQAERAYECGEVLHKPEEAVSSSQDRNGSPVSTQQREGRGRPRPKRPRLW